MNLMRRSFSVMLMLVLLVSVFTGMTAFAEDSASTRWADAADEIDKYLDAAFESYLDGDAKAAYLTMDDDHLIHLTEAGEKLAREAMHETVRRRKSYHELVGRTEEDEAGGSSGQRRSLTRDQAQRWLEKERADEIPEAILILSRRYYCVRVIDIAQFLGRSSAAVRNKLRQLEHNDLAAIGEESVVRLTEFGRTVAEEQYERHAPERERLIRAGQSPDEAERNALTSGTHLA